MTEVTKVSKEKFKAYVKVQHSGVTNMVDVKKVIKFSRIFSNIILSKEDCFCIMKNYKELKEKYMKK